VHGISFQISISWLLEPPHVSKRQLGRLPGASRDASGEVARFDRDAQMDVVARKPFAIYGG